MASRRRKQHAAASAKEPWLLWWMPVVALAAPIVFAAWTGASAKNDAIGAVLMSLLWPGVALYVGALAVLWGGWKIPLE